MQLLYLCVFASSVLSVKTDELITAAIGQLFEFGLTNDAIDPRLLPSWISFDQDESKIFGVPRWNQLENVTLKTNKDLNIRINLKAEAEQCGQQDYVFLEVFDEKDMDSFTTTDLRLKIKEFAEIYDVAIAEVRAFSAADLDRYRKVTQNGISLDYAARPSQLVLWIRLSCGDLYEEADTTIYETAVEQHSLGKALRLAQGQVLKDNVFALYTATPASASRTTRALVDKKPVLLNKINTIKCKRGIICQEWLPFNTFTDEDGELISLHPRIFSSGEHLAFLNISQINSTIALEGVALQTGIFNFRLEVRDHLDQVNDAPFNVDVKETLEANHVFQMQMDSRFEKFQDQPSLVTLFVRRLASYLGGRPEDILVESLEKSANSPTSSVIRWSNHSLSRKSCQEKQINETRTKMLNSKGNVLQMFRRIMGAEFHLLNIDIELRGTCVSSGTTIQISNLRASTLKTPRGPVDDDESGLSTGLLIALLAIVILLLLAIFVLVYFCLQRKRPAYKVKKNSSEYATKGHPVVFPDEMPVNDDDTNGVTAAVNTPMLVAHEHPPLNPTVSDSNTTLHENPLYKPPVNSGGTPNRNVQRLPPPYVAA